MTEKYYQDGIEIPSAKELIKVRIREAELEQEALKDGWQKGFDAAIELVKKAFDNSPEKDAIALWEEIEEEIELYKKDA